MKITKTYLKKLIKEELQKVLRESDWTDDYDGTPDPSIWEFDHVDPKSGHNIYKKRESYAAGETRPDGSRADGAPPPGPAYDEEKVHSTGGWQYTDDYDGHPGPGWVFSHNDPKSGMTFYKKPK